MDSMSIGDLHMHYLYECVLASIMLDHVNLLCAQMRMHNPVLIWPHVSRDGVRWVVLVCFIRWNLQRPDRGVNCPD